MKLQDLPNTDFKIIGREGNRVGYWCALCKESLPIETEEVTVHCGSIACNVIHKKCGCYVESIWEE